MNASLIWNDIEQNMTLGINDGKHRYWLKWSILIEYPWEKLLNLYLKPQTKLISRFIKYIIVNVKNIKYLKENIQKYLLVRAWKHFQNKFRQVETWKNSKPENINVNKSC